MQRHFGNISIISIYSWIHKESLVSHFSKWISPPYNRFPRNSVGFVEPTSGKAKDSDKDLRNANSLVEGFFRDISTEYLFMFIILPRHYSLFPSPNMIYNC